VRDEIRFTDGSILDNYSKPPAILVDPDFFRTSHSVSVDAQDDFSVSVYAAGRDGPLNCLRPRTMGQIKLGVSDPALMRLNPYLLLGRSGR
jgi:hypothetical protein